MKESNFQLIGKPKVTKMSYESNKKYIFKDELVLELNNNIQVIKSNDKEIHESIVVLNVGIFTSKDISSVPFQINIEIEGRFKWDDKLEGTPEILEIMLTQNAPAILYSYIRPIITLITVEGNMPPLVIPLVNFCE